MATLAFDKKFGDDFIESLPPSPGVYRVFNINNELIYVGKAKNLRRRLSQYRNVKRRKAHRKMKAIVQSASQILIECCSSDAEALRLELKLIQEHRPSLNVANAYSFTYPMIGFKVENGNFFLLMTSSPGNFPTFKLHGCFRSRFLAHKVFRAFERLFYFFGDIKNHKLERSLYSSSLEVKKLGPEWVEYFDNFMGGNSTLLLSELCLRLLEKSGAVQRKAQIQLAIQDLSEFWKLEIAPLKRLRFETRFETYPIPQCDRDLLVLNFRLSRI